MINFLSLKMLGTTTWYLKTQLLFYVFIVLAMLINNKRSIILLFCFSLGHAVITFIIGFPDFWWKTSLCFASGACIAKYKEWIQQRLATKQKRLFYFVFLFLLSIISYALIILLRPVNLLITLILYRCLSVSLVVSFYILRMNTHYLHTIGKTSLEIYIIHIGLLGALFTNTQKNIYFNIIIYLISTIILTIIVKCVISKLKI